MNLPTPPLSAASTRFATPSDRIRSFSRQARRNSIFQVADGMWVARLMSASWPAAVRLSASRSNRSTATHLAPRPSSCCRDCGFRARAVTSCPCASSIGTTRRPMTPVAPVTRTCIAISYRFSAGYRDPAATRSLRQRRHMR